MAKPLLIMLHGSGLYPDDHWADKHIAQLESDAATYSGVAAGGTLAEQVVLKPLRYDDVFSGLLDRWDAQGDRLNEFMRERLPGVELPTVVGFLNDNTLPPEERTFLWTYVLDPVFYRGVSTVRDEVRAKVAHRIIEAVNEHMAIHPGAEVSFIAQSLGTIVLHDVLHQLGTSDSPFASDRRTFNRVFMLANGSRLGPGELIDINPYESVVRPSTAPDAPGGPPYITTMYGFRNRYDPVASWKAVEPTGWGDEYVDVEVTHVRAANIHGFIHYLLNPAVHIPIFRGLLGFSTISSQEEGERVDSFSDFEPDTCPDRLQQFVRELETIRDSIDGGSFDDYADAILRLYRAIKSVREECAELIGRLDDML